MGVGLSICRAIVEAHGGKLWSEQSMGGCFRFTIPVKIDGYGSPQNA
jgi:signal transduction histidine kinase